MVIKAIKITRKKILIAVSALVIGIFSVVFIRPTVVSVFNNAFAENERKLPIYCVGTDEKKVAISFDAAWGAYNLR